MAKTTKTAAKKTTKAPKADAAPQTVKFVKGAFYEDQKGELWYCSNPKPKKTPDGHTVVMMQKTEDGVQVGQPGEEYTDTFVKHLTKAELKEYRDACQREREALADAGDAAEIATDAPADAKAAEPKKARARKEKPPKAKRMSCFDAAALVLSESTEPMTSMEMIEAMATRDLWSSPGGATPHATLYAAIIREIAKKGEEARFTKTDRGRFAAKGKAAPAAEAPPAEVTATPAEDAPPAKSAKKAKKTGGKKASA